jgi:4'-phosphopantetheinyl transferase EntD
MMDMEAQIDAAMARLAPDGVKTGCRLICDADEDKLTFEEAQSLTTRISARRRESGAARHLARHLLSSFGADVYSIPRSASGMPLWPNGFAGSLAHDDLFAAAAVARSGAFSALGIDIEPCEPLPADIAEIVVGGSDRTGTVVSALAARIVFCVKEAVYKAAFPTDGIILGYEDISVDLETGQAFTSTGRRLQFAFCEAPRAVALAWQQAS